MRSLYLKTCLHKARHNAARLFLKGSDGNPEQRQRGQHVARTTWKGKGRPQRRRIRRGPEVKVGACSLLSVPLLIRQYASQSSKLAPLLLWPGADLIVVTCFGAAGMAIRAVEGTFLESSGSHWPPMSWRAPLKVHTGDERALRHAATQGREHEKACASDHSCSVDSSLGAHVQCGTREFLYTALDFF